MSITIEELASRLPTKHGEALKKKYESLLPDQKDTFFQKASDLVRQYSDMKTMKERGKESQFFEKYPTTSPRGPTTGPEGMAAYNKRKTHMATDPMFLQAELDAKTKPTKIFKNNNPYGNKKVGVYNGKEVFQNSKGQYYYFTGKGGAAIIPGSLIKKSMGDVEQPEVSPKEETVIKGRPKVGGWIGGEAMGKQPMTPATPPMTSVGSPALQELRQGVAGRQRAQDAISDYDKMIKAGYNWDYTNKKRLKPDTKRQQGKKGWGWKPKDMTPATPPMTSIRFPVLQEFRQWVARRRKTQDAIH